MALTNAKITSKIEAKSKTNRSKSFSRPNLVSVKSTADNTANERLCKNCHLNKHCFNKSVDNDAVDELNALIKHPKPNHKGDLIYRQNDTFSSIFIVHSGAIKTHHIDKQGEEYITGFFLPGEMFGADGLSKGQHSQSAEALDTTSVCQIPISNIDDNLSLHPQVQKNLLSALCDDIHDRQQPLLMLHRKQAEQRLATFLSDISNRHNQRGLSATEFSLPMSRRDIAAYLGMAEETISRVFSRFHHSKILSAQQRNIKIHEVQALKNLSLKFF
jgi:CRP/FNR family transcriptional regulator